MQKFKPYCYDVYWMYPLSLPNTAQLIKHKSRPVRQALLPLLLVTIGGLWLKRFALRFHSLCKQLPS